MLSFSLKVIKQRMVDEECAKNANPNQIKNGGEKIKEKTSAYFKKLWRNPKRKIMNRLYVDKIRFGFNAETFILDKECDLCGINNEDHLKKYGQRLQIHHRDNQGRHNQRDGLPPNNQESNLQVLCKSCHVKVDNKLKDYTGRSEKAWRTRRKNQKKK